MLNRHIQNCFSVLRWVIEMSPEERGQNRHKPYAVGRCCLTAHEITDTTLNACNQRAMTCHACLDERSMGAVLPVPRRRHAKLSRVPSGRLQMLRGASYR